MAKKGKRAQAGSTQPMTGKQKVVVSRSSSSSTQPGDLHTDEFFDSSLLEERMGVGLYGGTLYVNGLHIHLYDDDKPACLRGEACDDIPCEECEFLITQECLLQRDPYLAEEIDTLSEIYASQLKAAKDTEELAAVIYRELKSHGRPLHYSMIAEIVKGRHPELVVTDRRVYLIMGLHSEWFQCIEPGIYRAI